MRIAPPLRFAFKAAITPLLALGLMASAANASSIYAFTEGGAFGPNADGSGNTTNPQGLFGMDFTVTSAITVDSLGFLGVALGGGDTPKVTLNNITTGTLLAESDWSAGAAVNGWNYQPLGTPITLTAGDTYQITAAAYWSTQYADTSAFTFGPQISSIQFKQGDGWSGWVTGTATTPVTSPNITANFTYTVAAVPEPSSLLMLTVGGIGMVSLLRRRKSA